MSRYLLQVSYTPEGWATLLNTQQDRQQPVRALIERVGGRVLTYDYAFGECDVIAMIEAPDNISAAAISLTLSARGGVKTVKTTTLLSPDEEVAALRKAADAGEAYWWG